MVNQSVESAFFVMQPLTFENESIHTQPR